MSGLVLPSSIRAHPRTTLAVFLLMVLCILAAGGIYYFITSLAGIVESQGSDRLGRKFAIEGPFYIEWDWSEPRIHAEGIKLANMPESKDPYMLEIDKLDFKIKIWKLLYGRTEIPEITIEKAQIILEQRDENTKNWEFPLLSKANTVVNSTLPDNRHDFPIIGSLSIKDSNLIYRDALKGMNLDLKLDTAKSEGGDGEQKFTVNGQGRLQDQVFEIDATAGSLDMLRDTTQAFPLVLDLKMGPTHIKVQGTFKDPVNLKGIDASLKLSGHNMADLFYLTGIPLPPTPPYSLEGQLGKVHEIWAYSDFNGKVGDSDLSGNLTYDTSGERGFLKANLASKKTDMDDLGGFVGMAPSTGAGETAAPEQKAQEQKEKASPRLLPDVPIALDRLRAADMDVMIKVEKLFAPNLPFNGLDVNLKLDHGLLTLNPMFLSLADGTAQGSLILDGRADIPAVTTNIALKKLKLSRFFAGSRFEQETQGTFGGNIELKGNGLSLADVLADSDGRIIMIMAGGTISLLLIEASDLDIAEATPLFFGDDKSTRIRCGVGDFKVTDGTLNSQAFVLDTTDSKLQGRVDINLKNETIDAELDADSKDVSLLSLQSPVRITGRLKSPDIGLQAKDSGLRAAGAAALGVVLTPFAAFIPYIETGNAEDSDCRALLGRARQEAAKVAAP